MIKPHAHIEDWEIIDDGGSTQCLLGMINNHPRQLDFHSSLQLTSKIVRLDLEKNEAETENTIYTLGKKHAIG